MLCSFLLAISFDDHQRFTFSFRGMSKFSIANLEMHLTLSSLKKFLKEVNLLVILK